METEGTTLMGFGLLLQWERDRGWCANIISLRCGVAIEAVGGSSVLKKWLGMVGADFVGGRR